ncbi:flavin reductase family protein [Pelotomaculum propionicicum]|uniref:flavin reductase family protein n=1 Tax=Pelotomaculum propionicicum TaxID=258475 RepID=UPI003B7D773B
MDKKKLGNKPYLYPYPVVMVGADVDGKPNFMTIAFCGIVNNSPGMIAFGSFRKHYTNKGILANKAFSVNIPSQDMLEITDYVGIYSGEKTDKSSLFKVFYGELGNAPMIEDCSLNMECKVLEVLDIGGLDYIIIGEIIETYTEDKYLTGDLPDVQKMRPVVLSMFDNRYFSIGEYLGQAWHLGKNYKR